MYWIGLGWIGLDWVFNHNNNEIEMKYGLDNDIHTLRELELPRLLAPGLPSRRSSLKGLIELY